MALDLQILTASQVLMTGQVDEVVAPSASGEVGIMPNHTQYITILGQGRLAYRQGERTEEFQITGGLARVEENKVTVLVDSILANLGRSLPA